MSVFCLIHGGWGVPREWDGLVAALGALGHSAVAVDLPITDPAAGLDEYAAAAVAAVAHVEGPVIVVAHSAGGYVAAMLPSLRPVERVVYLTAFVPVPGQPLMVRVPGQATWEAGGDNALVSRAFREAVIEHADGTCTADLRRLALFFADEEYADALEALLAPLLRAQGLRPYEQPWPLPALPDVASTYLLGTEDPVIPPASQRIFAARLGVEPVELKGADHGAHMKKVKAVAAALDQAARA